MVVGQRFKSPATAFRFNVKANHAQEVFSAGARSVLALRDLAWYSDATSRGPRDWVIRKGCPLSFSWVVMRALLTRVHLLYRAVKTGAGGKNVKTPKFPEIARFTEKHGLWLDL